MTRDPTRGEEKMNMRKSHLLMTKVVITYHTETSNDTSNNEGWPLVVELKTDAEAEDET
jgi:hypothetical protein